MIIDDIDKKIIGQLQGDLPPVSRPFALLADAIGISEDDYICRVNHMKSEGIMRRLGGILRQRESGYKVNAMLVWQQEEAEADLIGQRLSELEVISHLYLRVADEVWPYNMYAMVHARNDDELDHIYQQVKDLTGNQTINIVKSVREFKKISMEYHF